MKKLVKLFVFALVILGLCAYVNFNKNHEFVKDSLGETRLYHVVYPEGDYSPLQWTRSLEDSNLQPEAGLADVVNGPFDNAPE